jgi:uncharacterized HAD superfamily protein
MITKTSKPAVCLDLDDCTLNFMDVLCELHNLLYGTNIQVSDFTEWNLPDDVRKTFLDNEEFIYSQLKPKAGVINTLEKVRELGYSIVFLTARSDKFKRVTELNLLMNGIKYEEIFFNKRKALKINRLKDEYQIEVFADDKFDTVEKVSEKTSVSNVYLIGMPSNKNEEIKGDFKRIRYMSEILNNLKQVKEE